MSCQICLGKTSTIFAVSSCDHPICVKCLLRIKHIHKDQAKCPICREEYLNIFLTNSIETKYSTLSRRSFKFNKTYGLFLPKSENFEKKLNNFFWNYCHDCNKLFKTIPKWILHQKETHNLSTCELCEKNVTYFPDDAPLYTAEELQAHVKTHEQCKFCETIHFDRDALFKHLRTDHFWCKFCEETTVDHEFYDKIEDLKRHFEEKHWICKMKPCNRGLLYKAFRTEQAFDEHIRCSHPTHSRNYYYKAKIIEPVIPTVTTPTEFNNNTNSFPALPDSFYPTSSSNTRSSGYAGRVSYTSQVVSEKTFPTIGTPVEVRKTSISYKPKKKQVVLKPQMNFPSLNGMSQSKEPKVFNSSYSSGVRKPIDLQKHCAVAIKHKKVPMKVKNSR